MTNPDSAGVPDPYQRPILSVPAAGRFLGLSRASAYEAVARGDLPVIRLGRRMVVPTAALLRLLALDHDPDQLHEAHRPAPGQSGVRGAAGTRAP